MSKKTKKSLCETCKFYHGLNDVVCAVHPYGAKEENCCDWQQKNLYHEKKNLFWQNLVEFLGINLLDSIRNSALVGVYHGLIVLSLLGIEYSDLKVQHLELECKQVRVEQLEIKKIDCSTKIDLKILFWLLIGLSSASAGLLLCLLRLAFIFTADL
jgi:hypothetical protein